MSKVNCSEVKLYHQFCVLCSEGSMLSYLIPMFDNGDIDEFYYCVHPNHIHLIVLFGSNTSKSFLPDSFCHSACKSTYNIWSKYVKGEIVSYVR